MPFIEPAEFGKFGEVADIVQAGAIVSIGDDPAHMGPEKAEQRRGVEIFFLVGEAVMVAVIGGPPEDAFLHRS